MLTEDATLLMSNHSKAWVDWKNKKKFIVKLNFLNKNTKFQRREKAKQPKTIR
jgi:hypothetical protein